jgi:hypothetical protein
MSQGLGCIVADMARAAGMCRVMVGDQSPMVIQAQLSPEPVSPDASPVSCNQRGVSRRSFSTRHIDVAVAINVEDR